MASDTTNELENIYETLKLEEVIVKLEDYFKDTSKPKPQLTSNELENLKLLLINLDSLLSTNPRKEQNPKLEKLKGIKQRLESLFLIQNSKLPIQTKIAASRRFLELTPRNPLRQQAPFQGQSTTPSSFRGQQDAAFKGTNNFGLYNSTKLSEVKQNPRPALDPTSKKPYITPSREHTRNKNAEAKNPPININALEWFNLIVKHADTFQNSNLTEALDLLATNRKLFIRQETVDLFSPTSETYEPYTKEPYNKALLTHLHTMFKKLSTLSNEETHVFRMDRVYNCTLLIEYATLVKNLRHCAAIINKTPELFDATAIPKEVENFMQETKVRFDMNSHGGIYDFFDIVFALEQEPPNEIVRFLKSEKNPYDGKENPSYIAIRTINKSMRSYHADMFSCILTYWDVCIKDPSTELEKQYLDLLVTIHVKHLKVFELHLGYILLQCPIIHTISTTTTYGAVSNFMYQKNIKPERFNCIVIPAYVHYLYWDYYSPSPLEQNKVDIEYVNKIIGQHEINMNSPMHMNTYTLASAIIQMSNHLMVKYVELYNRFNDSFKNTTLKTGTQTYIDKLTLNDKDAVDQFLKLNLVGFLKGTDDIQALNNMHGIYTASGNILEKIKELGTKAMEHIRTKIQMCKDILGSMGSVFNKLDKGEPDEIENQRNFLSTLFTAEFKNELFNLLDCMVKDYITLDGIECNPQDT